MTDEELKKVIEMLRGGVTPRQHLALLRDLGLIKFERGGVTINRRAVELAWQIISAYL
ncbi:MAG: hypothetical protein QXT27_05110 [Pyrobaculum sp.]